MKRKLANRLEIALLILITILVLFVAFKVQAYEKHLLEITTKFSGVEFVYEESK